MSQLRLQEFDRNDRVNLGRPNFFDVGLWLAYAESLITADEVEKALWVLDNPPTWYQDYYPLVAKKMRDKLLTQFFTATDYAKDPVPTEVIGQCDGDVERGNIVLNHCRSLNDKGIAPHIFECAPGNFWLPGILKRAKVNFYYYAETLDQDLQRRARDVFEDHWLKHPSFESIFVCFETIEHLADPVQIYQNYLKMCPEAKTIFLSTPKYTWGGGMGEWYNNALGHLRTYSPKTFHQFASKYWSEFGKWTIHDGHVMCLVGEKV